MARPTDRPRAGSGPLQVVLTIRTADPARLAGSVQIDDRPHHIPFDGWLDLIRLLEESTAARGRRVATMRGPPCRQTRG